MRGGWNILHRMDGGMGLTDGFRSDVHVETERWVNKWLSETVSLRADGWIDGVMTRYERVCEKKDWWMGKQMDSDMCLCHLNCLWIEVFAKLSSQTHVFTISALKPYRCGEWEEGSG